MPCCCLASPLRYLPRLAPALPASPLPYLPRPCLTCLPLPLPYLSSARTCPSAVTSVSMRLPVCSDLPQHAPCCLLRLS
eukprot:189287-Chlamydomonas_euryale.AAC.1